MADLTPEEAAELAALEAEVQSAPAVPTPGKPQKAGLSRAEEAELAQLEAEANAATQGSLLSRAKEWGGNVLQVGAKGLDYAGGVARTAAAAPFLEGVSVADVGAALKGQPLSGAEILKRAGMPEGGSLSDVLPEAYSPTGKEWLKLQKGGALDPTGRGTAGLALEVAADPLTYLSIGGATAAKKGLGKAAEVAQKVVSPASKTLEKVGSRVFKSGLSKVDEVALKYGKRPPSEILLERGITGGKKAIAEKTDKLIEQLGKHRDSLLQDASRSGAQVDMGKALAPAERRISLLAQSKDPLKQEAAESASGLLQKYRKMMPTSGTVERVQDPLTGGLIERMAPGKMGVPVSPKELSEMKSSISQLINKKEFETLSHSKPGQDILKKLGQGFKNEVERASDLVKPGLGKAIKETNRDWGSLLTAQKKFQSEGAKGEAKLFTEVDALAAAFGGAPAFAAKQAAKLGKTTAVRTKLGKAIHRTGTGRLSGPFADVATRKAFIKSQEE